MACGSPTSLTSVNHRNLIEPLVRSKVQLDRDTCLLKCDYITMQTCFIEIFINDETRTWIPRLDCRFPPSRGDYFAVFFDRSSLLSGCCQAWLSRSLHPRSPPSRFSIVLALSTRHRCLRIRKSDKNPRLSAFVSGNVRKFRGRGERTSFFFFFFTCNMICEAKLYGSGSASSAADGVSMASRVPM